MSKLNPIIAGMSLEKACATLKSTTSPSLQTQLRTSLRSSYDLLMERKRVLQRSRTKMPGLKGLEGAALKAGHQARVEQAKIRATLSRINGDLALLRPALGIDTGEHAAPSSSGSDHWADPLKRAVERGAFSASAG